MTQKQLLQPPKILKQVKYILYIFQYKEPEETQKITCDYSKHMPTDRTLCFVPSVKTGLAKLVSAR